MPISKKAREARKFSVTDDLASSWQYLLGPELTIQLIKEAHEDIPRYIAEDKYSDEHRAKISRGIKAAHKRGAYAHRKRAFKAASGSIG